MRYSDFTALTLQTLKAHRFRSFLTIMGIAVGIASVVMLTSIGEGVHRYVLSEFTQFGTNLISITPGRTTTLGGSGAVINNIRSLTMEDEASLRQIPGVIGTAGVVQGNSSVEYGKYSRRTTILGAGASAPSVWQMKVRLGKFFPPGDRHTARSFVVLGSRVKEELFKDTNPLGKIMRVGGERYRVIGVMESKGQMLGFDLDDTVFIPAARALSLFNLHSLMEINLLYKEGVSSDDIASKAKTILMGRHGSEDFTIKTQEQMLSVLSSVLTIITIVVGGLGAISLFVGSVGIATIMSISVNERITEVGLLRAIGADRKHIQTIFLSEAIALSGMGGVIGLAIGVTLASLIGLMIPKFPVHISWKFGLFALAFSFFIGLAAGVLPARKAAAQNPLESLRAE